MKTKNAFLPVSLGLLFLTAGVSQSHGDIRVRISVKYIVKPDGTRPAAGNIGTTTGFDAEITRGNQILAATARGYRLQVVEYLDIQPSVPSGQASDYWFNIDARQNRATIENAATANADSMTTWSWNANALNIYVNNSSSGQCSFVGGGSSISLGNDIDTGTVLHEIGHFFNLKHTHAGDYSDNPSTPPFARGDLRDGDGLSETADDNPNISDHDQLSVALFGHIYNPLPPAAPSTATERAVVDSSFENVMSYHNENNLLPVQMDLWTLNANGARNGFCSGRTWFVAVGGSDTASGDNAGSPFATIAHALARVGGGDDVILIRSGAFSAPSGGRINTPCTLSATRGSATVHYP